MSRKPMTLKTESSPDRRAEIVQAATAVFAERGYEGASIREVAERCGLQKGHISYYFAVKDDLLFTVIDGLHGEFAALAKRRSSMAEPPAERLASLLRDHVRLVCERRDATRVSYENFRHLSPDRLSVVLEKRDMYERTLRREVAAAQTPQSPHNPTVSTRLILGLLNWPYTWWKPGGAVSAVALADQVASMAMAAVLLPNLQPPPPRV